MAPVTETRLPIWQLRLTDLWWLLAYPLYQTFGTIRHEGSHALAALAEGADVKKFVIYPQTDLGRFTWGYTEWTGSTGWFTDFAPYLNDLLWFVGFFFLITRIDWRWHALWLNVGIVGLLSPLLNSGVQYVISFWSPESDVAKLREGSEALVHLYFLLTLATYVFGIWVVVRRTPKFLLPPE